MLWALPAVEVALAFEPTYLFLELATDSLGFAYG